MLHKLYLEKIGFNFGEFVNSTPGPFGRSIKGVEKNKEFSCVEGVRENTQPLDINVFHQKLRTDFVEDPNVS